MAARLSSKLRFRILDPALFLGNIGENSENTPKVRIFEKFGKFRKILVRTKKPLND